MATTISVEEKTRERLKRFGTKAEDYDAILHRMMDALEALDVHNYLEKQFEKLTEEKEVRITLEDV